MVYCKRLNVSVSEEPSYLDKGTAKAAKLWSSWEEKESGWRKKVVDLGNNALKRIPFEEWGLKSIPPLSSRRKSQELDAGEATVEVSFPSILIPKENVQEVLRKLGTEREALHKSRMIYCFIGLPVTAPIALLPLIPNLPFFYLVYRAWSHWRALSGSKHIQFLLNKKLIAPNPSRILDTIYSAGVMKATRGSITLDPKTKKPANSSTPLLERNELNEVILLGKGDSSRIAKALDMPELHAELDRAIWQVQKALKSELELLEDEEKLAKMSADQRDQVKKNQEEKRN